MNETAKQEMITVRDEGEVVVFNSHLAHPTFMDIIALALDDEKDHGLKAIFFSEKKSTVEDYGWYVPELDAIVMSLPNVLTKTLKAMQENETGLSIAAAIWVNMIWTFFHELHHAIAWTVDSEGCEANREGQEEEAEAYAEEMLNIVADDDKAEGPALEELPWFNEHAIKALAMVDRKFMEKQAEMMEKGQIFDHAGVQYTNMKEYFKDAKNGVTEMENEAIELELKTETVEGHKFGDDNPESSPEPEVQPMEQMNMFMGQEGTCYDLPDEDVQAVQEAPIEQEQVLVGPEVARAAMTDGTPREAAVKMWLLLYNHMFATLWDGAKWINKEAIEEGVPINVEAMKHGIITGSRSASGQWLSINTGIIKARFFKNGAFPGFDVGMSNGSVFRLIAQNPDTGSQYANRAKSREKIAWLIDTKANKWLAKIDNGIYERL